MIAHRALSQRGALPQLVSLLHTSSLRLWPDVVIPPLGESVSEGTVSTLTKKVGDKVSVDEIVAQLETDKASDLCQVEAWYRQQPQQHQQSHADAHSANPTRPDKFSGTTWDPDAAPQYACPV